MRKMRERIRIRIRRRRRSGRSRSRGRRRKGMSRKGRRRKKRKWGGPLFDESSTVDDAFASSQCVEHIFVIRKISQLKLTSWMEEKIE